MKHSQNTLSAAIGDRVRHHRLRRGWTLDHLAEASSVSRRMLINVEQGAANPSVGTLLKLSEALSVGLPELVESPEAGSIKVTRGGQGALLWSGDSGGRGVLVASVETPDVLELWDWSLGAHDAHTSTAHTPGTRELLQVLDGSVTLDVDGQLHLLENGDAITFPGDVPHSYTNPHPHPARFTLTVFEPGRTPTHRRETNHA
ncbi:XRE family transcriptional regulator [Nesterenkonia lutea]|uniref:Mannose-6-phosphate isomerase-like protein (Cupin superfamily) n=1 Tax=Nesterenkonia lutea TaxID=272919 RepID=A0ABR9JG87_9MICC|nr:XRE family transcriptional regulator [Nesterenkonia lutea]MBE1524947.1 mannose-6-phosphate isomerase-like protein (cupin superfamily) [Nesterenkonia lutea]